MKSGFRFYLHIFISVLIMAFIFFQSSLTADLSGAESGFIVNLIVRLLGNVPGNISFVIRKLAHFSEYLLLGVSLSLSARDILSITVYRERGSLSLMHNQTIKISLLIGSLYAVSDELHQMFVPGRSCEIRDMIIDSCGVFDGPLIWRLIMIKNSNGR